MRTLRTALAVLTCSVALVTMTGVASAQQSPVDSSITATCNPATGEFIVTVTLTNLDSGNVPITDARVLATDIDDVDTAKGPLTFDPDELLMLGSTSSVTFNVPGNTYDLTVYWLAGRFQDAAFTRLDLCTPVPTTPTTVPDEPPTTAAPAVAAAAAPRFTG